MLQLAEQRLPSRYSPAQYPDSHPKYRTPDYRIGLKQLLIYPTSGGYPCGPFIVRNLKRRKSRIGI
jgi:hypothetical protein